MLSEHLLQRLKYQHLNISNLTNDLDNADLLRKIRPGKWSIHENTAHLACYQPKFADRLQAILATDNSFFERYHAEEDADFPAFLRRSFEELVADIHTSRAGIIATVATLNDEQLSRRGIHAKYGRLQLWEWIEFFLLHEDHHIYTIFQLRREILSLKEQQDASTP